jgi:hypothetical protein
VRVASGRTLEAYLAGFVAEHAGLRLGRMFGAPAAYAGRKLFSCVIGDGITAKLPPDAFELALTKNATRWTPRGRTMTGWVIFRPDNPRAFESVGPFLEIAARHVAQLADMPKGRKTQRSTRRSQ